MSCRQPPHEYCPHSWTSRSARGFLSPNMRLLFSRYSSQEMPSVTGCLFASLSASALASWGVWRWICSRRRPVRSMLTSLCCATELDLASSMRWSRALAATLATLRSSLTGIPLRVGRGAIVPLRGGESSLNRRLTSEFTASLSPKERMTAAAMLCLSLSGRAGLEGASLLGPFFATPLVCAIVRKGKSMRRRGSGFSRIARAVIACSFSALTSGVATCAGDDALSAPCVPGGGGNGPGPGRHLGFLVRGLGAMFFLCASGWACLWWENGWLSTRFRGRPIFLRRAVPVLVCPREVEWVIEVEDVFLI
jgi:hypothetical protein